MTMYKRTPWCSGGGGGGGGGSTMQYYAVPCSTMQYHAVPCSTMHQEQEAGGDYTGDYAAYDVQQGFDMSEDQQAYDEAPIIIW